MFEFGKNVYYVDFDGNLKQGTIRYTVLSNTSIKMNQSISVIIENERIGLSEEEAYERFEEWKTKYKNQLLQDNNWLKELFEGWNCSEDYGMPKEMIKIMKDVIREKTGISLEK